LFNIIIAVCCLVAGIAVGYKFSARYTDKYLFYKSLCVFNERFYSEISFFKKGIQTLKNTSYSSSDFENVLQNYDFGRTDKIKLPRYLNDSQKNDLTEYLSSLGTSDSDTQKVVYEAYRKKFESELLIAGEEQKKYCSVCKKTGLIVGLIAFIILF